MRGIRGLMGWAVAVLLCSPAWGSDGAFPSDAGRQGFGGSGGSWGETVTCESRDFRRAVCGKPGRGHAAIVRQISKVDCIEGRNWGQDRDAIWVDNGCAATFEVRRGQGGGQGGGPEVVCESRDFRYQTCNWRRGWGFPQLVEQISRERCVRDRNWGYDRRGHFIWVDRGCAARFRGQ